MADYRGSGNNDDFLKELRENYAADEAEWQKIRDEGRKDIRFISGDSWAEDVRRERESKGRLCLNFDELSQFVNQVVNESRQNKRAIQITPTGSGANDQKAQLRADMIRQVEYRSNAQIAYTTMFENTVQRSFGWLRIIARYVSDRSFDQELIITPIPNPDLVLPGPHVMSDGSDISRLWFHETRTHEEFKREFPGATKKDFSSPDVLALPQVSAWVQAKSVMIAEYWVKETKRKNLHLVRLPDGSAKAVLDDEIPKGAKPEVLKTRVVDAVNVCQYFTNGVEILKKTEWPGKDIPFVPCYGKVLFVTQGGSTERRMLSLVRLARDPQQLYNYYRTCEAELVGMTPKFPYFVRRGSLTPGELEKLQHSNEEPEAVIEVEALLPEMSATGPPEFPQRNPYEPPIQALEVGAESARRGIQASVGSSPLPTQAQRHNEKSGIALKQIQDSAQIGSFHLADNYSTALMRTGVIVNDLLPYYHDTVREVTRRKPDDTTSTARLNDPEWVNPDTQKAELLSLEGGDYDVTISTGPKVDSEREAASDFADLIVSSPQIAQVVGPEKMSKLIAKSIKLKNVGPMGDAMAEIIDPTKQEGQDDPEQMKAQMMKAQQLLDASSKQVEALTHQIQTDQVKMDGQIKLQEMKDATSIRVAEINAAVKGYQVEAQHAADHEADALGHAVEMHEGEQDRQHEAALAAMNHEQGMQAGAQDGAQQAQQSAQDHQQSLEQGAAGHEQQLEQGAQAEALAPQPET